MLALVAGCRGTPAERPNVVLYVVDTLRADALGCYGNTAVRTPSFDRVAREGTLFRRAYATSSWTRATIGSLLTGQHPIAHGAVDRGSALRPDLPTLAEEMRAAGYRTAAIIANPNVGKVFGFARGFDDFIELFAEVGGRRAIQPAELIADASRVIDTALAWIEQHGSKPFFLFLLAIDPHTPYTPPAPFDRLYDPDYNGSIDGSLYSLLGLGVYGKLPPEREIRHLRALYDGEVAYNDLHFGRLLDVLDRPALRQHTLTLVTSDHGEEFYEHGGRDHGHTLYEELIRVPLLVRWPGRVVAQIHDLPVQLIDLYPTVLQLIGRTQASSAGHDLGGILRGQPAPAVRDALAALDLDGHALDSVVRDSHKLIRNRRNNDELSYFDLAADPGEQQPLPRQPGLDLLPALDAVRRGEVPTVRPPLDPTQLPDSVRQALEALGYGESRSRH
jgi:arylsulfatase A-like enzyme